jgi:hypothetical protein
MDEHPSTMRAHKLSNIYEHFMELLFGLYALETIIMLRI